MSFIPAVAGAIEGRLRQRELAKILAGELKELSPLFRTLIGLFHEEELSYEEISGITGVPVGTVKSYLFRARKQLKEQLLKKYQKQEL
jgi:RNA polymerase sigma-70 factor (ECF subfamily)